MRALVLLAIVSALACWQLACSSSDAANAGTSDVADVNALDVSDADTIDSGDVGTLDAPGVASSDTNPTSVEYHALDANLPFPYSTVPNPERGFYHQLERKATVDTPTEHAKYDLDVDSLAALRVNEGVTLVLRLFYMQVFADQLGGPKDPTAPGYQPTLLSAAYLEKVALDLARIREAGLKAIMRFAYTPGNSSPPYGDASAKQVQAHIAQLAPILADNADVIAVVQAGFIGRWGEWYYTDWFGDTNCWTSLSWGPCVTRLNGESDTDFAKRDADVTAALRDDRRNVVEALLAAFPNGRSVQLRTPGYKTLLYAADALDGASCFGPSPAARIGHHNDCFLASESDFGTYWSDPLYNPDNTVATPPEEYPYLSTETRCTPMGGETCALCTPTTGGDSCKAVPPRSGCQTALAELSLFHWSFLNRDYHPDVLDGWKQEGCYEEIRRRLGYRLRLLRGTFSHVVRPGGTLQLRIELVNDGFAAPFNPRHVVVVLRPEAGGPSYQAVLPDDPRRWLPTATTYVIEHDVGLPSTIALGSYRLLLALRDPEPSLADRPEYAIRLANEGLSFDAQGMHHLAGVYVTVSAPGPAYNGTLVFSTP